MVRPVLWIHILYLFRSLIILFSPVDLLRSVLFAERVLYTRTNDDPALFQEMVKGNACVAIKKCASGR